MNSANKLHLPIHTLTAAVHGSLLAAFLITGCDSSSAKGAAVQQEPAPPTKVAPKKPKAEAEKVPDAHAVEILPRGPGRMVISVQTETELASELQLETLSAGEWQAVRLPTPLTLPKTGTQPGNSAECQKAPAQALLPLPSWDGKVCESSTCTEAEARYRSGSYRLVVKHCAPPKAQWISPPFEMPLTAEALPRWRASANASAAKSYWLNPRDRAKLPDPDSPAAGSSPDPERVAGYALVEGSEAQVDPAELEPVVAWLRSTSTFVEPPARSRCKPGKVLGLRIQRVVKGLPTENADIAIDAKCHSVVMDVQDGPRVSRHISQFNGPWPKALEAIESHMEPPKRSRRRRR